MEKKTLAFSVALFVVVVAASVVLAQMGVPHQFYGTATYNGAASEGIKVDAHIEGVIVETTFTQSGGFYNLKIKDPDENREEDTILFYVNGVNTGQTAVFENGVSTELNLAASGSSGGGGGSSGGGGGSSGGGGGSGGSSSSSTGQTVNTGSDTNSESSDGNQDNINAGITGAAVGSSGGVNFLPLLILLVLVLAGIVLFFGIKKQKRGR